MHLNDEPQARREDALDDTAFPAFAPIVSDAFDCLRTTERCLSLGAGTVLQEQDSPCEAVWLLRDGLVKLTHMSSGGREVTLGLRSRGWFAGAACVLTASPSVYSVRTLTPCIVSRLPADDFSAWLMRSARMMRHFTATLCQELLSQSAAQAHLMADSAEERLTHFMQERSRRHPRLATLDALPMLKQMELAQLLSITPEHLSRLMSRIPGRNTGRNGMSRRFAVGHWPAADAVRR